MIGGAVSASVQQQPATRQRACNGLSRSRDPARIGTPRAWVPEVFYVTTAGLC